MKLAEDWWNEMRNTITGFKVGSHDTRGKHKTSDEVKYYDAYPTLEIKKK
jgi:hypothetical protein